MNLNALVTAFAAHNWLAAVLLFAVYLRFLFSDESKFPATWNPNYRPLFVAVAGDVIVTVTARDGGSSWSAAIIVGFVGLVGGGFFDGLAVALFGSTSAAPAWARWLVWSVDSLASGGGSSAGKDAAAKKDADTTVSSPALKMRRLPLSLLGAAVFCVSFSVACQQVQAAFPVLNAIEAVVAKDLAAGASDEQIAADVCQALGGNSLEDAVCADSAQIVQDVVTTLLDTGVLSGQARSNALALKARASAKKAVLK
jgi:hypothetical protein